MESSPSLCFTVRFLIGRSLCFPDIFVTNNWATSTVSTVLSWIPTKHHRHVERLVTGTLHFLDTRISARGSNGLNRWSCQLSLYYHQELECSASDATQEYLLSVVAGGGDFVNSQDKLVSHWLITFHKKLPQLYRTSRTRKSSDWKPNSRTTFFASLNIRTRGHLK